MINVFQTRLAARLTLRGRPGKLQSDAKIKSIVDFWFDTASRFYETQTVQLPFEVNLVISKEYEHVLEGREFPEWSRFIYYGTTDFMQKYKGQQVAYTRLDADDWYSNDFFEYIDTLEFGDEPSLVLYKKYKQYHRYKKVTSGVRSHNSPHFATLLIPNCTGEYSDLDLINGGHGSYRKKPHITAPGCYAMEGIGGNQSNRWGGGSGTPDKDPRFTY